MTKKTLVACRIVEFYIHRLLLCSGNRSRYKGMPLATKKLLVVDRGESPDQQVP